MKIKKGDMVIMLPPHGEILGVVCLYDDGAERRRYMVPLVYLDTLRREEMLHPDLQGRPIMACVCGMQLKCWPAPDRDTDFLIRYYPPEVEA
jgi:hypothetical protein